jgi:hypothetical protein
MESNQPKPRDSVSAKKKLRPFVCECGVTIMRSGFWEWECKHKQIPMTCRKCSRLRIRAAIKNTGIFAGNALL